MATELASQGNNVIIHRLVGSDAGFGWFQPFWFQKQGHSAGQLALNGPWGWGNATLHTVSGEKILQSQTLLVIFKKDVIAEIEISH